MFFFSLRLSLSLCAHLPSFLTSFFLYLSCPVAVQCRSDTTLAVEEIGSRRGLNDNFAKSKQNADLQERREWAEGGGGADCSGEVREVGGADLQEKRS